jgi:purine-binding chemotaxis protein CheW
MAVGPEALAIPIAQVREILQAPRLTPLPRTPDFLLGVMNLRGAVVPVIDLARRLGGASATLARRSCVVVVEVECSADTTAEPGARWVVGLMVDAVYEVFDAPSAVEPVPPLGTRVDARMLAGMVRARGEVIGMLALERALASTELAALIAAHEPAAAVH